MSERYQCSEEMLARALKSVPLGSQTFSKSKTQYPWGVSPFFIKRGAGSHVWDVDGNEYIDYISSLAAITLGHGDPDVDAAVMEQIKDGVIFSLPHPLEVLVAEKMIDMVPCAEKVRFGKNGSDATAGAVRIARAYTGRERVLACGYHGWQDWYIGSTARNRGVPRSTQELTTIFPYNDLDFVEQCFERYPGQVAAVILEPMNVNEPSTEYLQKLKDLTHRHGAVYIFDETITGFRYSNGGAQEFFGVTPDLATFGKGLANGYPLSAIAGKAEIMNLMEEIFFSFTFGGETLSLAAALATLTKLQNQPILELLAQKGQSLKTEVDHLIQKHELSSTLSMSGHPSWSFLNFKETNGFSVFEIKTLFYQEIFARGILTLGSHNLSHAHSLADIERLLEVYDEVFSILKTAVKESSLHSMLRCKPLEPLFKLR